MPSRLLAALAACLAAVPLFTFSSGAPARAQSSPAGSWTRAGAREAPPARQHVAMAFDAARGEMVMFGGLSRTGRHADTWVRASAGPWRRVDPPSSPSNRTGAAMAYDAARGKIVMFGGHGDAGRMSETWLWDGVSWTQVSPATSPPGRSFAAMTYDAARGEIVMFGGMAAAGGSLADTWTWDGTNWTREEPAVSPPLRDSASLTFDSVRREVVLFGGYGQLGPSDDTWTWDGATWTQEITATAPPARNGAGIAFEEHRGKVVLFGGIDRIRHRNDTWTWDGSAWTEVGSEVAPHPRSAMGMAYDSVAQKTILFGGGSANLNRDDTWAFDGTAWTPVDALQPDARHSAVAIGDSGRKELLLFGGMTDQGAVNDTWTWDGAWHQHRPENAPPARTNSVLAYDEHRNQVVLFGGMGAGGVELGDTWVWDGNDWSKRETTIAPPPRHNAVMTYDAKRRQVVLFGGSNGDLGVVFADTWTWNGLEWTLRTPARSPPPLSAASMTYDAGQDNVVLFGGYDQNVQRTAGTWTWNGFNWEELTPQSSPSPRAAPHLTYDPILGTPLLYGGNAGLGDHLRDTWAWTGDDWVRLDDGPEARWGAIFAYDAGTRSSVLFGGNQNQYLDDTWVWRSARRIGADPLLEVDERSIDGPFWFVYRVSSEQENAKASFEIEPSSRDASAVAYGLFALRASDEEVLSFLIGTGDTRTTEVYAKDTESGIDQRVAPVNTLSGRTSGFTTTFDDLSDDDYYFVIVNTSPWAERATIRLATDSNVDLVGITRGDEGGLARETDFEGPRNIHARTGAGFVGANVGVIEDGRVDVGVDGRLFGIYQSMFADPNDVSYVRPDGTERAGQTTYVLANQPAGNYTFKANDWRAVRTYPNQTAYIALLTADVLLPGTAGTPTGSPPPSSPPPVVPRATELAFTERSARSGQYSDEVLFETRLTDDTGGPLPGRDIVFELVGSGTRRSFTATTDDDGIASVDPVLNEAPGTHNLTARFAGGETLISSADTMTFTVEREHTSVVLEIRGKGSDRSLAARLVDADSTEPIPSAPIAFSADGTSLGTVPTTSDGWAHLDLPPRYRGGHHTYEAHFAGDTYYLTSSDRRDT